MSEIEVPAADGGPFDPAAHPRRLNVGCGFDAREGYLNIDFQEHHHPDLLADVRDLPMLPSGGYTELLAIDVLEHLPRSDTATCLAEWARLLEPGGAITVQVPDVTACGRQLRDQDTVAAHEQLIHQLWGTQAYTGDFHLAGFTDLLLVDALAAAGFHRIELEARDGWMLVATAEKEGRRRRDPLAVGWVSGFYAPERVPTDWWRWTDSAAELLLFNISDRRIDVDVSFGVSRPDGQVIDVAITWGADTDVMRVGATPEPWSRVLSLEPGPGRLLVSSPAAPLDAPADPRRLVVHLNRPVVAAR